MNQSTSTNPTILNKVLELTSGFWVSQLVRALAKHGVLDPISNQERSVLEISQICDINADQCARALRAAEGLGLVTSKDNKYLATEFGQHLTLNHPSNLRDIVLLETSDVHTKLWQNFDHTLKTGQPACKTAFPDFPSNSYFHALEQITGHSKLFEKAMKGYSQTEWSQFDKSAIDFSVHDVVVDVGSGDGYLLEKILLKFSHLKGIFFDQPFVVEAHKQTPSLTDRYSLIGGDFFKSVPSGDAYILKHILHDWSDDMSIKILSSVRSAALQSSKKAKLYVAEMVIEADGGKQFAKLYDLHMAVVAGGRERNLKEIGLLLEKAGWRVEKVFDTDSDMKIIQAVLQ